MTLTLPTPLQICNKVAASYALPPTVTVAGDVRLVMSRVNGVLVVSFPGTRLTSAEDILRDLATWPVDVPNHPKLGRCHEGFVSGAEAALPILQALTEPFVIGGHSLGGGEAVAAAALLIDGGVKPLGLTVFGCPRVSLCSCMGDLITASGIPVVSYRNGNDPITEEPFMFFLDWHPLRAIGVAKTIAVQCHYISAYQEALK